LDTQPEASRRADWRDECACDAAALADRLGAEGVAWLDSFLADYVFPDEPLDQVLLQAREISRLPPR
jgi:hypothetical protein